MSESQNGAPENQSMAIEVRKTRHCTPQMLIMQRHEAIMLCIDEIERVGRIWDEELIVKEMIKRGWEVTKRLVTDDMKEINKNNSFVIELSRKHYSRMVEYCYENIKLSVRECNEILSKQWSNSKQIEKESISDGEQGNKMTKEEHRTVELAGPKLKAIDIRNKSIAMLLDILKGGIVDVGVAQMDRDFGRIKLEIQDLNDKIKKYEEKYGKLEDALTTASSK